MRRHGTDTVDLPATDGQASPGDERRAVVHTRAAVHDVAQPVTVMSSGVIVGLRAILDFIGPVVADVSASGKVTITISTSPPYTSAALLMYPTLAAGVTLASTTSSWVAGSWTQLVPPSTIATAIVLVGYKCEPPGTDGQVELGVGAAPSTALVQLPVGASAPAGVMLFPIPILVAANTEIRGRAATTGTSAKNFTLGHLLYYPLPL